MPAIVEALRSGKIECRVYRRDKFHAKRFYEPRTHPDTGEVIHEERYLNAIWPQVSQVHDLHFGPAHGTFFTPVNRLTLESRFGPKPPKKKMPHV